MKLSYNRYLAILCGLFAVWWVLLAIKPLYRADWALENALVLIFISLLVVTHRWLPFSRTSYTLIFVFFCLHEIGAHYTYAKVPYDQWFQSLTGRTLNSFFGATRNHFDRLGHLSFGLLLTYPIREIFVRVAQTKGFWGYYFPLVMVMGGSMVFELLEWAAAEAFGGDLGAAYLGTQGDQWDAHKDMLLATIGAVVAMMVTALINMRYQRDFAREWVESLRVKKSAELREPREKKARPPKRVTPFRRKRGA